MNVYDKLKHTTWECKYHVVFIPKCRKKVLFGQIRRDLGGILRSLALQKESRIEEGDIMPDHVHMLIAVPPKYAGSQVVGFMKGKSALQITRMNLNVKKNFTGMHFWARGYFVSTVGRDEQTIREYIKSQGKHDLQMNMFGIKK